jgi:hypothetical protein
VTQAKFMALIVAATAAFMFFDNVVKAQPGQVCSGKLVKDSDDGGLTLVDGEAVCVIDPSDAQRILTVCAEGHDCQVKGKVSDCEESGECVTIKNITSVKDLTTLASKRK